MSLLAALVLAASVAPAAPAAPRLAANGTVLEVTLADGAVRRSPELIGAVLWIATGDGGAARVRLDAVEPDPTDTTGTVFLHSVTTQDQSGNWVPICDPGPDGRRQAIPLAGQAAPDGMLTPTTNTDFTLVCTGGARAKCVRFGYHPWQGGEALRRYNACVRLVRADYGGTHAYTRNGMTIDLYDDRGIQKPEPGDTMPFEAGWTEAGAVCVAHPRVPENGSLADIVAANPRLAGRVGPAVCTEANARAWGAIIFNRSKG